MESAAGASAAGFARVHASASAPADARWLALIWALAVAAYAAVHARNPASADPAELWIVVDDAMRLVQLDDWLSGQGWWDLRQTRLGAVDSLPMHWSRVPEAMLAALVLPLEPMLGREQAVWGAAALWPLLVAAAQIAVAIALAARLGGMRAAAAAALLTVPLVLTSLEYRPGRVDYHALQTLLVSAMLWLLAAPGVGRAVMAGLLGALSLAVGVATAPVVAGLAGLGALYWALTGERRREAMAGLLALALGVVAMLLLTQPPAMWLAQMCDALAMPFAVSVGGGAMLGAGAIAIARGGGRAARLGRLGGAGALAAVGAFAAFPHCLGGPYAALPAETQRWLQTIGETAGADVSLMSADGRIVHMLTLMPALGLAGLLLGVATAPKPRRWVFFAVAGVLVLAWAISLVQVRGLRLSLPIAVVGGGFLAAWVLSWRGWWGALKPLVLVALLFAQTPFAGRLLETRAGSPEQANAAAADALSPLTALLACVHPERMAALAAQPRGRVAAAYDLGPFVLLYTDHWVLGSSHHRNIEGNVATGRLVDQGPDAARAIVEAWEIDYLLTCSGLPRNVGRAWLLPGAAPDWLTRAPVPGGAPKQAQGSDGLTVWKVVR